MGGGGGGGDGCRQGNDRTWVLHIYIFEFLLSVRDENKESKIGVE